MSNHYTEKVDEAEWQLRKEKATVEAQHAFERLVSFAEGNDTGQARTVARFVAGAVGCRQWSMVDARTVDICISDDMLTCVDGVRWGKRELSSLISGGLPRCMALLEDHGIVVSADTD